MGTKMAVAFSNIFMNKVVQQGSCSLNKQTIITLRSSLRLKLPIRKQHSWAPYKGERFERDAILDVRTHFKPTETFQYTHFSSCHPQGVKKGFIKGDALRLLRTNSSKIIFEEKITNFKAHLLQRGYPEDLINTTLSEVNFKDRKLALQQKPKTNLRILPFVTQYQPSVPNLKQILMKNWHLIEKQPLLRETYKKPPLVSHKRGRSLKDILVRAKLWKGYLKHALGSRVGLSTPFYTECPFPAALSREMASDEVLRVL